MESNLQLATPGQQVNPPSLLKGKPQFFLWFFWGFLSHDQQNHLRSYQIWPARDKIAWFSFWCPDLDHGKTCSTHLGYPMDASVASSDSESSHFLGKIPWSLFELCFPLLGGERFEGILHDLMVKHMVFQIDIIKEFLNTSTICTQRICILKYILASDHGIGEPPLRGVPVSQMDFPPPHCHRKGRYGEHVQEDHPHPTLTLVTGDPRSE